MWSSVSIIQYISFYGYDCGGGGGVGLILFAIKPSFTDNQNIATIEEYEYKKQAM